MTDRTSRLFPAFAVAALLVPWMTNQRTINAQGETQPISEVRFSWPNQFSVCGGIAPTDVSVRGEVPRGINLADHSVAKAILSEGLSWAQQRCTQGRVPSLMRDRGVFVILYWQGNNLGRASSSVVSGRAGTTGISEYGNYLAEEQEAKEKQRRRDEQERQQAEERRRRAEEEAKRQAEERARGEAQQRAEQARQAKEAADRDAARQNRWNEFVRRYGVQEMIDPNALTVNPFVYQGKTVAIHTHFERMVSPDTGLFANESIIVSGLPRDLFRARSVVVLVGRVTGTTGQTPQLKFVGVHFCRDYGCSDLLAQR